MRPVRSAILLALLILVVSLVATTLSLLQDPDSDGRGRDSYGTRGPGFRAIHDLLSELGIRVERGLHPPVAPTAPDLSGGTIAFLAPDPGLAGVEPTYLKGLLPWVESGGRLVVAVNRLHPEFDLGDSKTTLSRPTLLESLDLADASILSRSMTTGVVAPPERRNWRQEIESISLRESWSQSADTPPVPMRVKTEGTLSDSNWPVGELLLPGDTVGCLDLGQIKTSGLLLGTTGGTSTPGTPEGTGRDRRGRRPRMDDSEFILAAVIPRGGGEIVLIAEPALFSNRLLAKNDNSVLAARLLSPEGAPVLIDEFYHGLSVRGNVLYLLTRPGYLALALGPLLCTGLVVWREAIFLGPSLPDETVPRRDIGEYIAAMAQFFSRGRRARPYLVRQVREGVLRQLSTELSLPPEIRDVDLVAGVLSRTNPQAGDRCRKAFRDVDDALDSRGHWSETQTLDAMRRLTACLSKRV